ncbi:MAG: reverse transcriptase domain-containing protein [Sedimenticola sp.]
MAVNHSGSQKVFAGLTVLPGNASMETHANISTPVANVTGNTASVHVRNNSECIKPSNYSKLPTPVHVEPLSRMLQGYDKALSHFLVHGFTNGFSIDYTGPRTPSISSNHASALQNKAIVQEKLAKELKKGCIAGPFDTPPFSALMCSPIGLIPKKDPGTFRIIHDLSHGDEDSVNAHIPKSSCTVQYDSIDSVISLVQRFGRNCLVAKSDIENAYRIIPLTPGDYELLGFTWDGKYYYDKCLPMGCSSSCSIFETLSKALQWIMENKFGAGGVSHVIDDFVFVNKPGSKECQTDLDNFVALCGNLGIPIKHSKTVNPTTTITVYGYEVDTTRMEVRLPSDKVEKIKQALANFRTKNKATLQEIQSLIGLLNFACSVVVPGRAFLRRLIQLTIGLKKNHHHTRLNNEARADIRAWLEFVSKFNGKNVFLHRRWVDSEYIKLYTDAAGVHGGFAAIFGSKWFVGSFPESLRNESITVKELLPIVLAVEVWGNKLANHKVMFYSDNAAVVDIINTVSSKHAVLMRLIRRLVVACLSFNILFRAHHIPGKQNVVADKLSRFQFQEARRLAPWLDKQSTPVPVNISVI